MYDRVEKLQIQIGDAIQANRSILETAEKEDRGLTAEERQTIDENKVKLDDLIADKKRYESMAEYQDDVDSFKEKFKAEPDEPEPETEYRDAFKAWMRTGKEQRALDTGTGAEGGYIIPEGFYNEVEVALKAFGGMREVATILNTEMGNDLPIPTTNDTTNTGSLVGENTQLSKTDVEFGQKILKAYMFTSDIIPVSLQMLQDSGINLEAFLGERMGERIGRAQNTYFTTGTGTAQPEGITDNLTVGVNAAGAAAITFDELVELQNSIDPAYQDNAKWMFNQNTKELLQKLKDGNNLPLFSMNATEGMASRILGKEYVINQQMPDPTTGNVSIVYGDLSKYWIRNVTGVEMIRLNERYADFLQVGFMAYARADGLLVDAGTNPVKSLVQA